MSALSRRARQRAFTLVELMVVVVIVSVLGVIGLASFRSRIFGSKTSDGLAMMQSMRAAEERWRSENLTYLNVTQTAAWYPATPSARTKRAFYNLGTCGVPTPNTDDCRWKLLNPTKTGSSTEFGFMLTAGPPLQAMTEPLAEAKPSNWAQWPSSPPDHWFVLQAIADMDGDGVYSKLVASSIRGDVYHENDGE